MAEIVGGFLMPHNPRLTSAADSGDPAKRRKVFAAFERITERVKELRADTVIIIGDDHYTVFGPHCLPRCLIGIGHLEGPAEDWLRIERSVIGNNEALAQHILKCGYEDRIDWSFAKALTVDHSIAIPYHLAAKSNPSLRAIPVYLNAAVMPVIESRRAFEIGQSIARAVRTWSADERVVIYGTGGISHWVGGREMGRVNSEFDRNVLDLCAKGDVEALIAISDEEILRDGGDGALEIKNWICAMAALPGAKGELIAYADMPEWITGLGFAELKMAA